MHYTNTHLYFTQYLVYARLRNDLVCVEWDVKPKLSLGWLMFFFRSFASVLDLRRKITTLLHTVTLRIFTFVQQLAKLQSSRECIVTCL